MSRRTGPVTGPVPVTVPRRWVEVPGGWAAPGLHRHGVAPRLEHRAEPCAGDLARWAAVVAVADASLPDFDLEDDDAFDLEGRDVVYRRYAHASAHWGVPLMSEQWLWVVDGVGHRLVGTVARQEYADYCDVFESVAATFDPVRASRSA